MRRHRFPQLAIRCSWCKAPAGDLCSNPRTRRIRTADTHFTRYLEWVETAATCPVATCQAAPGSPCIDDGIATAAHDERCDAADRAHTAANRQDPTCPPPPAAPAAATPSAGPAPRPAEPSP